jgi:hypothetical protein
VGEGHIDADADVLERREGGVEVKARMRSGEGGTEGNAERETPEEERHRPRMRARQEGSYLRIEAGRIVQRDEEEQIALDREGRRTQFMRKRDEYLRRMERGINIPRLNKKHMRNIKTGLEDLFKYEISPLITEFEVDSGDWGGWCAFEGACAESMHKIGIYVLQALNRDTSKLYGVQQVNALRQAGKEQRMEQVINHQLIRRTLSKMNIILDELIDGNGEEQKGTEEHKERTRRDAGNGLGPRGRSEQSST